jgi:tetratricopeptide (TPR) repeat protein
VPSSLQNEVALLEQYNREIEALGDRLSEADPQTAKGLQKQIDQKLQIYGKQVHLVQTQFPDVVEGRIHESAYYTFQALRKLFDAGLMRRVASRSGNMAVGITTGLIAKQQERSNANQALAILDQALGIFDYPGAHLQKAHIYRLLNQTGSALQELNYIIANFQDDDSYLAARQMKDEIENPPKKGMCFVATATYGTPLAAEVIALSRFRDEVLLTSLPGKLFVKFYCFASPACARLISGSSRLRIVVRVMLLQPILWLLPRQEEEKSSTGKCRTYD